MVYVSNAMNTLIKGFENNPSARAIILHTYQKAQKERYGGYWTRQLEDFTGVCSDRSGEDTGMEPENHYQE